MSDLGTPILGTPIGEGFVFRQADGAISGHGSYCGFPLIVRLIPDQRDGKNGYRVALHIAPKAAPHA